jgi:hypothetical protein
MRTVKTIFVVVLSVILLTGIAMESKAQISQMPKTYVNVSLQNVPSYNNKSWNAEITMYFVGINYSNTFYKTIPGGLQTDFTYILKGYASYTGTIIVTVKLHDQTYIQFIGVKAQSGTWNSSDQLPIVVDQWSPVG